MICIEDKIQPHGRQTIARDITVIAILCGLFAFFIPTWFGGYVRSGFNLQQVIGLMLSGKDRFANQMVSHVLLMGMAMLLSLRYGIIDLGVWVVSAAGGLLAAVLMQEGVPALGTLIICMLAGFLWGGFNGLFVCLLKIPSFIVTAVTALILLGVFRLVCPFREIVFTSDEVAFWFGWSGLTLYGYSALIIILGYAGVLMSIMWLRRHGASSWPIGVKRHLIMGASGALACMSGVQWLAMTLAAPVPHRLVDDLHVPAAVLLAGGLILSGRGRTLLACVFLPISISICAAWKQNILLETVGIIPGYSISLGLLIIVMILISVIITICFHTPKAPPIASIEPLPN